MGKPMESGEYSVGGGASGPGQVLLLVCAQLAKLDPGHRRHLTVIRVLPVGLEVRA